MLVPPTFIKTSIEHSLIYSFAFVLSVMDISSSMRVHVNYTHPRVSARGVPDEFNITLHPEFDAPKRLCLKRVEQDHNIPVFTLNVDKDGRYVHRYERLDDNQNIGYYQDPTNGAFFQVTRVLGDVDGEARFVLKGELNIEGRKYTLSPGTRVKRDSSSVLQTPSWTSQPLSSNDEPYNLVLQTSNPVMLHDYIEAPPEAKRKSINATKFEIPDLRFVSLPSNLSSETSSSAEHHHRKTRSVQSIFIDVVIVADYATYRRFQTYSESKSNILQAMREYYAFIYNGVDLRYQGITSTNYVIRVRLIKIIITETAAAGAFTEQFRVRNLPWDEVNAQSVLSAFSEFAVGSGSDILNPYDHAMLFTGYDLTSTLSASVVTNGTTGLAFTSTLCRTDGKSVSVVEDLGGFQAVDTAAHELGHSLSARHDGDGNTCHSSDRYIMASGSSQITVSNKLNPWLFSSCSITSFTNFIRATLGTARGQTCLTLPLAISPGVPDVSTRLPGQEFPPDQQCRMIYGSASRLCRGPEFGTAASVCTSMFCFDPSSTSTCFEQTAAMGTTCGDGRLCLNGQCVLDSRAPVVDDDCVFGDQPGIAFDRMSCPDFVHNFSGFCYQDIVRGRCCTSCKQAYRAVKGCEYGDKVRGCTAAVCSFSTTSYLEQCCGTCNYGTTFTVPTRTVQASRAGGSGSLQTTSATIINVDPGRCEDNPNILVNRVTCAEAVTSNPSFCYQTDVSTACCASCHKASSGIAGTEIGELEDEQEVGEEEEEEEEELGGVVKERENEQDEHPEHNQEDETEENEKRERKDEDKKEEEEMEREDELKEKYERSKGDKEEMMAKTYIALSIHINPGCEYGDRYPTSCKQAKSCEGITTECCQTCSTAIRSTVPAPTTSCIDQQGVLVNNMSCADAIRQYPYYCYTNSVMDACCLSCKQKNLGIKGCEFGDQTPQKCKSITIPSKDCQELISECCLTCASSAQRNMFSSFTLVMIPCLHILTAVFSVRSIMFL